MSIILVISLCILCYIMFVVSNKDPLSPVVIHPFVWSISILGSFYISSAYIPIIESWFLIYLIAGVLLFIIGFFVTFYNKYSVNTLSSNTQYSVAKSEFKWLLAGKISWFIILAFIALTLLYILEYIKIIRTISSTSDIFLMMRYYRLLSLTGDSDMGLLKYIVPLINSFTNTLIIIYFSNKKLVSKFQIIICIILILILAILGTGRGILLAAVFPIVVNFLIMKQISRRKIKKYIIIGVLTFVLLFLLYEYLYQSPDFNDRSTFEILDGFEKIPLYLSGGVLAFATKFSSAYDLQMGSNTFRFFWALIGELPRLTIDSSIQISATSSTNVYTVYRPYVLDFGFFFGLIVMLLLGLTYGLVYKKTLLLKPFWVFLYSFSLFPLLMQPFDDRYFTTLSTWIQTIMWGILFLVISIKVKKIS